MTCLLYTSTHLHIVYHQGFFLRVGEKIVQNILLHRFSPVLFVFPGFPCLLHSVCLLYTSRCVYETDGVVACATIGTKSRPHVSNEWIKLPVMAFLLETEGGYILSLLNI